jgi:phosphoglycerate kinase
LKIIKMSSLDLRGKRVLIREDLNVPIKDGVVSSDARIARRCPPYRRRCPPARVCW